MKALFFNGTRARLRAWLALGYALFLAYGSLTPFNGWRAPEHSFTSVLTAPLRHTYTTFDATLNVLSYLPLGLLLGLVLRSRFGAAGSALLALVLGALLSLLMEYLQLYLPARISSNTDWLMNMLGTLAGVTLAWMVAAWGGRLRPLVEGRSRLFHQGKDMDFGLALLAMWLFAQANPSLPMLGHVFIHARAAAPWADTQFAPWESLGVSLNLLMLGLLLRSVMRANGEVLPALGLILGGVAAVKFLSAALLLKSWALWLWVSGEAMLGLVAGLALVVGMLACGPAIRTLLGLLTILAYLMVANLHLGGNSPGAAASIYHWHYGHLLNYNGLARTVMQIFPLLLAWHLWRTRHTGRL